MALIVKSDDWDSVNIKNIEKLLTVAMNMMDNHYNSKVTKDIIITNNPEIKTPLFYYDRGVNGEYMINITAKDSYFCQYLYQFFHEYCHLRMNCNPLTGKKAKWFDESIAELASFFGMLQLSKIWNSKFTEFPLCNYNNNNVLDEYINKEIQSKNFSLEDNLSFKEWLKQNINELELNQYIREKNGIIANKLLSEFTKNKILWELLTYWNTWDIDVNDDIFLTMKKWKKKVPQKNKKYIEKIEKMLF